MLPDFTNPMPTSYHMSNSRSGAWSCVLTVCLVYHIIGVQASSAAVSSTLNSSRMMPGIDAADETSCCQ